MNKLINKFCNKEVIFKILMFFLIIQPVLDIYILFDPEIVSIFRFSPSTIIRTIFIGVLSFLTLFTLKWTKKYLWIVGYIGLVLIYTVLHHLNAVAAPPELSKYGYSMFSEFFYIIRMLFPLAIIVITYHLDFSESKIQKIITWLLVLTSGTIFVTNLCGISLASYSDEFIKGNMITWFIDHYNTYGYMSLASRGFFTFANRTAAFELLITPIWFYFLIKDPSKKKIFLTIIHILALFMLGTKVATIGIILLIVLTFLIYLYFSLIDKEFVISRKLVISYIGFIFLCVVLVPFSPALNRNNVDEKRGDNYENKAVCKKMIDISLPQKVYVDPLVEYETDDEDSCPSTATLEKQKFELVEKNMQLLTSEEEQEKYLLSFIEEEYDNYSIKSTFILKSYPYTEDPYFWYDIMKKPLMERTNYRLLEQMMLEKVKLDNPDLKTELFGISYIRMSNIFNLERDFVSHYYTLGWIGLILLLFPYLIIVVIAIVKMLCQFKKQVTCYNVMLLLGIGITLFAAFYSGNVMDGLTVTLILGFVMGLLLKSMFSKSQTVISDKKISILMPTYNDAESICETMDSVLEQTYPNWELIIIDDGSTDHTKEVIEQYKKEKDLQNKITYVYQENQDQLKALICGSNFMSGDYVSILHSDDLFSSPDALTKSIQYLSEHSELDAIIADLIIIDKNSVITGRQRVLKYQKNKKIPPLQLLWLGRNLYIDVAIHTKESFLTKVKENYLTWNTPFWLSTTEEVKMLNVKKVDFEFYKYRVHSGNYIHNEIGKLNVINGELRTATRLMKYYEIPNYQKQYIIFRIFSKLNLLNLYTPKYEQQETKNKAEILDFIIRKRFPEGYQDNIFFHSLVEFYKNRKKRKIEFSKLYQNEPIYLGNEMRKFNKQLTEKELPKLYIQMMKEMEKGFDEIIVKTEEEKEKAINLTKFLCIYPFVKVTKK